MNLASIKEIIDLPKVHLRHVMSDNQCADVFTKFVETNKWNNPVHLFRISEEAPKAIQVSNTGMKLHEGTPESQPAKSRDARPTGQPEGLASRLLAG